MIQIPLNVFDSNHDGKLDASDAKFGLFKVMVTNADGSTTAHTLTELGITSINLKADLTHVAYADGLAITGEATFTKSDGITDTVVNATWLPTPPAMPWSPPPLLIFLAHAL